MRRIRYYCDRCAKEIEENSFFGLTVCEYATAHNGCMVESLRNSEDVEVVLCRECADGLKVKLSVPWSISLPGEAEREETGEKNGAAKAAAEGDIMTAEQEEVTDCEEKSATPRKERRPVEEIREKIQDGLNRGLNQKQISDELEIAHQRVSYCVKKYGLKKESP